MLLEDFLRPLGLQQSVVADELGIRRTRLNELHEAKAAKQTALILTIVIEETGDKPILRGTALRPGPDTEG